MGGREAGALAATRGDGRKRQARASLSRGWDSFRAVLNECEGRPTGSSLRRGKKKKRIGNLREEEGGRERGKSERAHLQGGARAANARTQNTTRTRTLLFAEQTPSLPVHLQR